MACPPQENLDFRPSEIVSGAIQPRGPETLLRVSVPSLIPSRADSGWGLSQSWLFFGRRTLVRRPPHLPHLLPTALECAPGPPVSSFLDPPLIILYFLPTSQCGCNTCDVDSNCRSGLSGLYSRNLLEG